MNLKFMAIGGILLLFIFIYSLQSDMDLMRTREGLWQSLVLMPGEIINEFVLSGFSGIAADLLWIRADEYWHEGEWHRAFPLYRTVTWLQPNFIVAWSMGGWHLAYNMYAYTKDPEMKKYFLESGINFLKEGILANPNEYQLYFELGWTYFHKAEDYDSAIRYFRRAVKFEHPHYIDRLIAHAYRKKGDIAAEYKEWQRCLTLFQDASQHHERSRYFLEEARKKLELN